MFYKISAFFVSCLYIYIYSHNFLPFLNTRKGEMFVKNYLMNEAWNEEEDSDVDYSSGEELADRKYHKIR